MGETYMQTLRYYVRGLGIHTLKIDLSFLRNLVHLTRKYTWSHDAFIAMHLTTSPACTKSSSSRRQALLALVTTHNDLPGHNVVLYFLQNPPGFQRQNLPWCQPLFDTRWRWNNFSAQTQAWYHLHCSTYNIACSARVVTVLVSHHFELCWHWRLYSPLFGLWRC